MTATPGTAQITLTWTAPTNPGNPALTGYQIFRGTTPGGESGTPLTTVTATTYTDTTTTPGVAYYYTVKAASPVATSVASNEVTATPNGQAPGPPTAFIATPGTAQITLTWTAPTNPGNPALTGYQIFRGTTPGGESGTPLTTVTGTSFTDTSTTPGVTYYYTVKAASPVATSVASNEASATANPLAPDAPTALTATPGVAQITLTWTAPTNPGNPALTGYQIFRGTTPGGESSTALATVTGNLLHRHHHHPRHHLLLHRQSRQPPDLLAGIQRSQRQAAIPHPALVADRAERHGWRGSHRPVLDRPHQPRQPRPHRLPDLPRHHPRRRIAAPP